MKLLCCERRHMQFFGPLLFFLLAKLPLSVLERDHSRCAASMKLSRGVSTNRPVMIRNPVNLPGATHIQAMEPGKGS